MPHQTRIARRIVIRQAQAFNRRVDTVDVFAHRIEPRGDHGFDDIMHLIVATSALVGEQGGRFQVPGLHRLSQEGLEHPFARFHPACLQVVEGRAEADAEIYSLDGQTLTLPDGTVMEFGAFAPPPFGPMKAAIAGQAVKYIMESLRRNPVMQVALGSYAQAYPRPYRYHRSAGAPMQGHITAARAARLLSGARGSGQAASRAAWTEFGRIREGLHSSWAVAPDRGWAPDRMVLDQAFHEYVAECDPALVEIGAAVGRLLAGNDDLPLSLAAWSAGDDERLSNHERLFVKREIAEVDRAIEDAAAPEMLKRAAANRRARRRASRPA